MARKRRGQAVNGWLIVDKDQGITSTAVVGKVRRAFDAQKAGHGGTLDPLATGVLPIALGEATKTVPYVMDATKSYRFTVRFGEARDTDDAEGAVVASSDLRPTAAEIEAALTAFRGPIQQVPPDYAAVKVAGKRAYDLARRGEPLDLASRLILVHELQLEAYDGLSDASFVLTCGKGAYVRALARDLGQNLGCFGHVTALRRTAVGRFTVEHAVRLQTLEHLVLDGTAFQTLVPVTTALADIPALAVTEPQAQRLRSGQAIRAAASLLVPTEGPPDRVLAAEAGSTIRAMQGGGLVAIARFEDGWVNPVRVFNL